MARLTRWAPAAALALAAGLLVGFVLAIRSGGPRTKRAVRALVKRTVNPVMLLLAGRRHWYAAVLRHTGRRSGRAYATPVVALPAGDAFVIPLPYGEHVDWLRNWRAAGRATLVLDGVTYDVGAPEVVDASGVAALVDERHRRAWRWYRIETFVRAPRTAAPAVVGSAARPPLAP
ncbi:nitroreductase/quinone reductase family protein [Georgenia thermotolerans]|uniref:DUF385 domain-containing protein n=1 Tax=Georgenia thermotolerans TaxID=527326 RepID=A0A7J5ULL0_9MICO|nr:nitroreductase/quinone reductase family protein [Georgenia thermotolerans]KAE8763170.1 DUF385 domain-containing protein [Georgenia thermotolerans]